MATSQKHPDSETRLPRLSAEDARDVDLTPTGKEGYCTERITATPAPSSPSAERPKTARYWIIVATLCVVSSLPALEGTVVSTALPSIIRELQGGETYVWVINAYFLSSTAFQPLYGQTANIFGRRWLLIFAVAFFILGSALSGAATSMAMLIAGSTVQGIGGGGCSMMIDMIISDLVPLRDRGVVMGYIFGAATICTALGPFIGGTFVQSATWRWVFFVNIPIASLGLVLLLLFLHVEYDRKSTLLQKLGGVDMIGNSVFIAATIALLIALTHAGTLYAWSNWKIILPLALGFVGLAVFGAFEMSPWCPEPTLPHQLFGNRTSAAALVLTFLHMMFVYWEVYFLPVYFQVVKHSSPARSGVQLLPTVINLMVFAAVGGGAMKKTGKYIPTHAIGFGCREYGLADTKSYLFKSTSKYSHDSCFWTVHAAQSVVHCTMGDLPAHLRCWSWTAHRYAFTRRTSGFTRGLYSNGNWGMGCTSKFRGGMGNSHFGRGF